MVCPKCRAKTDGIKLNAKLYCSECGSDLGFQKEIIIKPDFTLVAEPKAKFIPKNAERFEKEIDNLGAELQALKEVEIVAKAKEENDEKQTELKSLEAADKLLEELNVLDKTTEKKEVPEVPETNGESKVEQAKVLKTENTVITDAPIIKQNRPRLSHFKNSRTTNNVTPSPEETETKEKVLSELSNFPDGEDTYSHYWKEWEANDIDEQKKKKIVEELHSSKGNTSELLKKLREEVGQELNKIEEEKTEEPQEEGGIEFPELGIKFPSESKIEGQNSILKTPKIKTKDKEVEAEPEIRPEPKKENHSLLTDFFRDSMEKSQKTKKTKLQKKKPGSSRKLLLGLFTLMILIAAFSGLIFYVNRYAINGDYIQTKAESTVNFNYKKPSYLPVGYFPSPKTNAQENKINYVYYYKPEKSKEISILIEATESKDTEIYEKYVKPRQAAYTIGKISDTEIYLLDNSSAIFISNEKVYEITSNDKIGNDELLKIANGMI